MPVTIRNKVGPNGKKTNRTLGPSLDRLGDERLLEPTTAKGREFTQQGMALVGLPIPGNIHFQIEGVNHIRTTRVAGLDELAKEVGALDEDKARLGEGVPVLISPPLRHRTAEARRPTGRIRAPAARCS